MMLMHGWLFLVICWSVGVVGELQQVVSVFRHGARYPLNHEYDADQIYYNSGELTAVGMRQHCNFGRMLRRDYIEGLGFLSKEYVAGEIKVYSTDVNRTLMSVQSQLMGMYPFGMGRRMPQVEPQLHLPPYTNTTDAVQGEYSLPEGYLPIGVSYDPRVVGRPCNLKTQNEVQNIKYYPVEFNQMNLTYYPFMMKLSTVFGIPLGEMNLTRVEALYSQMVIDKYLNREIPVQITEEDYYNMQHIYEWYNHLKISRGLASANNNEKFIDILNDFGGRVDSPSKMEHKWRMMSAHDGDMSPLLLRLNISSAGCVEEKYRRGYTDALNCEPSTEYVSSLIFELHSDEEGRHHVKIRHNGRYVYLCERREVSCPWEEFEERIRGQTLTDEEFAAICGADHTIDGRNQVLNDIQLANE